MNNTNIQRRAGAAIPVFSLRSRTDYGAGQFSDIKLFADWAKSAGLSLIQILPVNDTSSTITWQDSYPYSGISVFALHPLYLDLTPLMECFTPQQRKCLQAEQDALNALTDMDYEKTISLKWRYAQIAYDKEGGKVLASEAFKDFFAKRKEWLTPYAVFCYLRSKFGTADFTQWEDFAEYSPEKIAHLTQAEYGDFGQIGIHYYMQFLLHQQLKDASAYCRQLGIALKGDIPIGISRNSCDAWVAPHLYNMNVQTGAPPDAFSATGQNWGFPTYNWDSMAKDKYRWWKSRLAAMSEYFDAFRIDHILGFFRIWEIPLHSLQGLLGCFAPALPLSISELNGRGAWFDADRLCKPYIRKHILKSMFGINAGEITQFFMEEYRSECYRFKPEFDTQCKLEAYFAGKSRTDETDEALKAQLFDLLNDVVLIEDRRQPHHYHPRIAMHYTRSYRELDEQQKSALDAIYIDFFYHRHNEFWKKEAMNKLSALCADTDMLVCGEDLGMVPQCVPEVMNELRLLGLIIQRMPNDSSMEFASLGNAPFLSVCSPSSHDMSGIREWWEEDRALTQRFYNNVLCCGGEAPCSCEAWIARRIILQHLHSPAVLAIFPLQDLLATDERLRRSDPREERINIPANPHHYWRYRMHICIEDLMLADDFNNELMEMVSGSGRVVQ